MRARVPTAAIVAVLISGCGGSSDATTDTPSDPQQTVSDFIAAVTDGDYASACDLLATDRQMFALKVLQDVDLSPEQFNRLKGTNGLDTSLAGEDCEFYMGLTQPAVNDALDAGGAELDEDVAADGQTAEVSDGESYRFELEEFDGGWIITDLPAPGYEDLAAEQSAILARVEEASDPGDLDTVGD